MPATAQNPPGRAPAAAPRARPARPLASWVVAEAPADSLFSLVAWNDVYQCADCREQFDAGIVLEAIPWGGHPDGEPNTTRVYPDVLHPSFGDASCDEDDDEDDEDSWADKITTAPGRAAREAGRVDRDRAVGFAPGIASGHGTRR